MYKVLFFLNTKADLDLVAVTRSFLNKQNIDYKIDYYNLDLLQSNNHFHMSTENKILFMNNLKSKNNTYLSSMITENSFQEKIIKYENTANMIDKYDLYCFPSFHYSIFYHINNASILRMRFPQAKFLFGGPEISLNETTRRILTSLDFDWSIGDIDISVYNALFNNRVQNLNNYSTLNNLTEENVPVYTDQEIKHFLNGHVTIHLSRGCNNNCYYCPTPAMFPKRYNAVSRNVAVKWIKKLVSQGMTHIDFADNNITAFDFDILLDGLLEIQKNNSLKVGYLFPTLKDLTEKQISKMANLVGSISPGIECINPTLGKIMNKKHITREEIIAKVELLEKYGITIAFQYITMMPMQTDEIMEDELNFLKVLSQYKNVTFKVYQYVFIPGSYIFNNYEKFNCQVVNSLSNINDKKLLTDDIQFIFEKSIELKQDNFDNQAKKIFESLNRVKITYDGKNLIKD